MNSRSVNDIIKRGEDFFLSDDLQRARECFESALSVSPTHVEALNNLGVICSRLGDLGTAISFFRNALSVDEHYVEALENIARCLEANGEYAEARFFYQKLVELGTAGTEILNSLANCCVQLGDLPAVKAALSESLRINPDQDEVIEVLHGLESYALKSNGSASLHKKNMEADSAPRLKFKDAERGREKAPPPQVKRKSRKIGFVSIWFERGQSYVTKMLRDVLAGDHETFVFARTGGVHGRPMLETHGAWHVPNLTTFGAYQIPHDTIKNWIAASDLDVVIFNEEYDWSLVEFCKDCGVKVATYLDYYKDEWRPKMSVYDAVLCSTKRTYHLVRNSCAAHYVGWAVDTQLFKPVGNQGDKAIFFHNAGWLGINFRKMTPAVILAFDALSREFPEISLFVHAQCELEKLPIQMVKIVKQNPRIQYHVETVPAPGLYHKSRVLLFPTKLEGLGLPLLEALACGLPAVATDAAPMNEFIRHGYNGLLVRVAHRFTREDNIAFPEEVIDVNDLVAKMRDVVTQPKRLEEMSSNARNFAETELDMKKFAERVNRIVAGL
jgi:glycosyltransferase involved in cell wall biosynthesis